MWWCFSETGWHHQGVQVGFLRVALQGVGLSEMVSSSAGVSRVARIRVEGEKRQPLADPNISQTPTHLQEDASDC